MSNLLYHYCPTQSFHSIIKNESLWLTSLSLSNDSMEGHLARELFRKMVQKAGFTSAEQQSIELVMRSLESNVDGLGFCLSSKNDQLSQWRGYGDDGKGFSIGFKKSLLEKHISSIKRSHFYDVFLMQVLYDSSEHEALLTATLDFVKGRLLRPDQIAQDEEEQGIGLKILGEAIKKIITALYQTKSDAFKEESEFRLFTFFQTSDDDIQFKPSRNLLTPYWDLKLERDAKKSVSEVMLGPKNVTPINLVEKFLSDHNFHNVKVVKSKATYR